ncbi:MAG TPA: alpha/beta hydrolase [Mycobacterium sp.]|nr:alpha/beta hydrolase [Mycobacterium sp.]
MGRKCASQRGCRQPCLLGHVAHRELPDTVAREDFPGRFGHLAFAGPVIDTFGHRPNVHSRVNIFCEYSRVNKRVLVILGIIVACEIGFWLVIAAGLVARYLCRAPRTGAALLALAPAVDLVLLVVTTVDLHRGASASWHHGLAALYLGLSLAYGHRILSWADSHFAYRFGGSVRPTAPSGRDYARQCWGDVVRTLLGASIAGGLLLGMIAWIGSPQRSVGLDALFPVLGLLVVIDFLWAVSYTLWPRKPPKALETRVIGEHAPRKGLGRRMLRGFAVIGVLVFALGVTSASAEHLITTDRREKIAMAGELIDAGGFDLHVVKQGDRGPVVVMEAGSGETSLSWRDIPAALAEDATVITYDRAGYAWSELSPNPRTGANIAAELRTALHSSGVQGPYVLVGHSLGGMYVREFAQLHPDEVAALVLIDARPEDDAVSTQEILDDAGFAGNPQPAILTALKMSGALRVLSDVLLDGLVAQQDREAFLDVISSPSYFTTKQQEADLAYLTEDAIRGQNFGGLPVRIIARGKPQDYTAAGIPADVGEQLEAIWQDGQRKMLNLSTGSTLTVATESGHMIIHDQPDLVIATIKALLKDLGKQ